MVINSLVLGIEEKLWIGHSVRAGERKVQVNTFAAEWKAREDGFAEERKVREAELIAAQKYYWTSAVTEGQTRKTEIPNLRTEK